MDALCCMFGPRRAGALADFATVRLSTGAVALRTLTQNQRDIEDALIRLRCARRVGDEKEALVLSKRVNDLLDRESRGTE